MRFADFLFHRADVADDLRRSHRHIDDGRFQRRESRHGDFLAALTVDVVSRSATRRLTVNGSAQQLYWDWSRNCVELYDPAKAKWESVAYEMGKAEKGYNENIGENMYIDELRSFVDATLGRGKFVNTLADDHAVLRVLYAVEEAERTGSAQRLTRA